MEISLAGWSLNRRFRHQENPLSLLEFPRTASNEFGIHAIELNSPFFVYNNPSDPVTSGIPEPYLTDLRRGADDHGVRILSVAVDGHGDLAALREADRKRAVDNHKKWVDVCLALGGDAFRANSGGDLEGEEVDGQVQQCIESFGELSDFARQADVRVMMENHGGISASAENIVRVMETIDSEYCRVLADFLNWPSEDDPLENLERVAPFAWATHAKFLAFDPDGESPDIDCGAALRILDEAGYQNHYGIEYEGEPDDHEGILKSRDLIERHGT